MIRLYVDNYAYEIFMECTTSGCSWKKNLGHGPTEEDLIAALDEHLGMVVEKGPTFWSLHGVKISLPTPSRSIGT